MTFTNLKIDGRYIYSRMMLWELGMRVVEGRHIGVVSKGDMISTGGPECPREHPPNQQPKFP